MSSAGASEILDAVTGSLAQWLPTQRWFAGKGRAVHAVTPVHAEWLIDDDPGLVHAVVSVASDGPDEPTNCSSACAPNCPNTSAPGLLGRIGGLSCYDATLDFTLGARLLDLFTEPGRRLRRSSTGNPTSNWRPRSTPGWSAPSRATAH